MDLSWQFSSVGGRLHMSLLINFGIMASNKALDDIYIFCHDGRAEKINADGINMWRKKDLGGGSAIAANPKGGVYVSQWKQQSPIIRYDDDGNTIFSVTSNDLVYIGVLDADEYFLGSNLPTFTRVSPSGDITYPSFSDAYGNLCRSIDADKDRYIYLGIDKSVKKNNLNGTLIWSSAVTNSLGGNSVRTDGKGNVYVRHGEYYNNMVKKLSSAGAQLWSKSFLENGSIGALEVDKDFVYVYTGEKIFKKINASGAEVMNIDLSSLNNVTYITVDSNGYIYIALYGKVRKYSSDGTFIWEYVSTAFGGSGFNPASLDVSCGRIGVFTSEW